MSKETWYEHEQNVSRDKKVTTYFMMLELKDHNAKVMTRFDNTT